MSIRRIALTFLALAGVAPAAASQAPAPSVDTRTVFASAEHRYRLVKVADSLANPWGMTFLPGGDLLFTERAGRLRVVRNGRLVATPVSGLPTNIKVGGQAGLLDVALHPQFAQNRLVYVSYAKGNADGSENTTAVIRGRLQNDALMDVQEIFEAKAWSRRMAHNAGRLAFDRNGYLFITVGDRQEPPQGDLEQHPSQLLTTHAGKVIRLHDDGRVPSDNPFVGRADALPEIYSYGHRNPQGLFVHPETNEVWATEHGPQGGDELNLIQAGKNYGWPVVGFGVNYGSGAAIHASTTRAGMENGVKIWVPSIATSGLLYYTGDKFPEWKGDIFAGGLAGQVIYRLTLNGRRVMNEEQLVHFQGRVRDVRQSPDGYIYVAFDGQGGALTGIYRLEPVS